MILLLLPISYQVFSVLQYFKESVKDEVDLLPADKRQRFFQIDIIILGVCGQAYPNYSK